jgi:carboxypeptidase PM20D1
MAKRLSVIASILFLGVLVIIIWRAVTLPSNQLIDLERVTYEVDIERLVQHLQEAIQFKTVSLSRSHAVNEREFEGFISWLKDSYPLAHENLELRRLGGYSLLFKWQGSNEDLNPALINHHYDVVPVIPGTETDWTYPPFRGEVAKGYVWGRGALDDKGAAIAMMESVELMLERGIVPERTLYFSLGHDEEVGGTQGAASITEYFIEQGIRLAWSLDEGSFVLKDMIPGVERPVASINIAEKGYLVLRLLVQADGGHSSVPPKETAISILSDAVSEVSKHPLPMKIEGVSRPFLEGVAAEGTFLQKMLIANQWIFASLLDYHFSTSPPTNAIVRTTTAPTILKAGVKPNVLPSRAEAIVNFRLMPGDTVEAIVDHVSSAIDDDRIQIEVVYGREASRVSESSSEIYTILSNTASEVFGEVVSLPGITLAATDSKHFEKISENSYRFNPMVVTSKDIAGFHGRDERVSIDNLVGATIFYARLIEKSSVKGPE